MTNSPDKLIWNQISVLRLKVEMYQIFFVCLGLKVSSLTAAPDQTLSSAEVDSVPARVLQSSQSNGVNLDRERVPQYWRHDGAAQDTGLPVGRGPAWSRTLARQEGKRDERGMHPGQEKPKSKSRGGHQVLQRGPELRVRGRQVCLQGRDDRRAVDPHLSCSVSVNHFTSRGAVVSSCSTMSDHNVRDFRIVGISVHKQSFFHLKKEKKVCSMSGVCLPLAARVRMAQPL